MWPYRPQRITDLLEPEEIRHLLGFGAPARLRSAVALIEPAEDGGLRRFDGERGPDAAEDRSPFCDYLRHGEIGGVTAFAGADRECSLCEARLAERALAGRETAGPARAGAALVRSRCHMGLTDFAAPVVVRGEVIGAIVAGQCVEEEEQRSRIAKSVGKIGKLTRGEMRSLEEAGARIEAPIQVADERAREALLDEIPKVPLITQAFRTDLSKLTEMIVSLAGGRIGAARARWDEAFLASLPRPAELPARDEGSLDWLRSAVFELRQRLRLEYVAVFAPYPRQLDEENLGVLPLAAQSGLALEGEEDLSYDPRRPLLELDSRRLDLAGLAGPGPEGRPSERETTGETAERVATAAEGTSSTHRFLGGVPAPGLDLAERSRRSASSLISALRPHGRSASRWKDVLTKSLVVAPITTLRGLEAVFLFGYRAGETHPESDDLIVLHRSAERLFESYRQLALELALRRLAVQCDEYRERLKRHAEEEAARRARRKSPLRPQRFDLSKLLEQCLDRHRDTARRRNVSFDVRGLPERLMLQADRNKLEAVLTTVLHHVSRNARSDEEQSGPSVLISLRRERQDGRLSLVFDTLGEFLDPDEQRRLLRSGTPPGTGKDGKDEEPRAAEPTGGPVSARESTVAGTSSSGTAGGGTDSPAGEPSPNEPRPAAEGKEKAPDPQPTASNTAAEGERSASDPDSRPASREPTSPGSPPGAPGPGTARGRTPSPISFRECRRYLSWHGGRLGLECVRTARQAESSGRWLGRVIFTVSFRPIEASPEDASGPGSNRPEDPKARAESGSSESGSSGRPRRTRSRRGPGGRRGVAGERPVTGEPPREARGERNGPAAAASSREVPRGERREPRPGSGARSGVEAGAGEDAADPEPDARRSKDSRKGAG